MGCKQYNIDKTKSENATTTIVRSGREAGPCAGKSIRNRWQMTAASKQAQEEVCPLAEDRHWKWQCQIASWRRLLPRGVPQG